MLSGFGPQIEAPVLRIAIYARPHLLKDKGIGRLVTEPSAEPSESGVRNALNALWCQVGPNGTKRGTERKWSKYCIKRIAAPSGTKRNQARNQAKVVKILHENAL